MGPIGNSSATVSVGDVSRADWKPRYTRSRLSIDHLLDRSSPAPILLFSIRSLRLNHTPTSFLISSWGLPASPTAPRALREDTMPVQKLDRPTRSTFNLSSSPILWTLQANSFSVTQLAGSTSSLKDAAEPISTKQTGALRTKARTRFRGKSLRWRSQKHK
jgi:hypothetical protein